MGESKGDDLYGGEAEDTAEVGALSDDPQAGSISMRMACLLFSDIVAITPFFDKYGDLAGHERIRVHNELLFPVIQKCRGRVVKTIGDAIMAVFDTSDDGVDAAVGMQQALAAYNREHTGEDGAILVRIGLHIGKAIVDGADIFGDAVNVAARVSSEAQGEQILISAACLERLDGAAFPTSFHARTWLKGKESVFEIHEVDWRSVDKTVAVAKPLTRRHRAAAGSGPATERTRSVVLLVALCLLIGGFAWWLLSDLDEPSPMPVPEKLDPVSVPVPDTDTPRTPPLDTGADAAEVAPPPATPGPVAAEVSSAQAKKGTRPPRRPPTRTPKPATAGAMSSIDPAKLRTGGGQAVGTEEDVLRLRRRILQASFRKGVIQGDLPAFDQRVVSMNEMAERGKHGLALEAGREAQEQLKRFKLTPAFLGLKLSRLLKRAPLGSNRYQALEGDDLVGGVQSLIAKKKYVKANYALNRAFRHLDK